MKSIEYKIPEMPGRSYIGRTGFGQGMIMYLMLGMVLILIIWKSSW